MPVSVYCVWTFSNFLLHIYQWIFPYNFPMCGVPHYVSVPATCWVAPQCCFERICGRAPFMSSLTHSLPFSPLPHLLALTAQEQESLTKQNH